MWVSRLPVPEPIVDADAEYVRGEIAVCTVEGYPGEYRATRAGAVAGARGIGALAEIHMEILRGDRPCTIQADLGAAAGHPAGARKIPGLAEGGGRLGRSRCRVTERAV